MGQNKTHDDLVTNWTFHDLGIEDASVRQIKSDMAIEILKSCQAKKKSLAEIAELYGIPASELSTIRNANYDRFTIDRLVRIHARLEPEAMQVIAVCRDREEAGRLRR